MAIIIWSSSDKSDIARVFKEGIRSNGLICGIWNKIDEFPPEAGPNDVVLACGSKALLTLQTMGLVPKGRSVRSVREKPLKHNGASVLLTYDPRIVNREYERLPDMQWDFQLAIRLFKSGTTKPELGEYRWVESFHELIERVEEKYAQTGKPVEVACDLETKSLNPYNPDAWIISCGFTVDEGKADAMYFQKHEAPREPLPWESEDDVDYWSGAWLQLHWLLNTDKISLRGANFKYDQEWLKEKWNLECSNFKFDTALVGSLLDENRSNSLKLHAKIKTSIGGYEAGMAKYDMSCVEKVPKDELCLYQGGDTDATYRVANVLKKELLVDKQLTNFYVNLLHPASKAFQRLERNGVCVDQAYYARLKRELEHEILDLNKRAVDLLPHQLRYKYLDHINDCLGQGKSPFTPKLITEFMFTPRGLNLKPLQLTAKTKAPSTSVDHLMMFEDHPVASEFIKLFKEMGSASKTYTTYVVGFLKHLREDGKFHPSYMLYRGAYGDEDVDGGTVTGRTSAKDPAIQTLPKHTIWTKRLRKAFIAPPGMTILQLDYSQGELKITAIVAEEPNMLQAYLAGEDLHAKTAAKLNGYDLEDFMALPEADRDELRSGGKAGNFGLIYGMQALGYRTYAQNTYGVVLTEEEAFGHREAFFDLYDKLPVWHEHYKNLARRWGFVRSPLGRVRHLPLINSPDKDMVAKSERQAINSPIQSCLSDMMLLAMVEIDKAYGHLIQSTIMTHDSLALYVPEDRIVEWAGKIKGLMETLPLKQLFGWEPPLVFTADAEAGATLADLKKLKNLEAA